MKLKLKDGKVLELENAQDGLSIAKAIAVSLAKKAIAIKVDGELEDLSTVIDHDAEIEIITKESPEAFQILNHSAAHVLAQAIMRLYPDAQLEYGPSIEEGFFYDIGFSSPVSEADFAKIEKEMSKIADEALPIVREEVSLEKAKELAKNKSSVENAYKEVFNELSMYATKWKEELKNNVYTSLKAPEYVEKAINFIDTFVFAQDYDEFRKNFLISVNANLKPKINAKCDESEKIFFNILIENYYKKIKKICDSIPDINTYISIFDDEQKYKLIILNLAAELKNRLDNYKKINSYFEFDDIALMVLSLFRNYPDIALEVKNSYDEIMVDEYQDNSDLQESIINTLEKDNLFSW